MAQQLEAEFSSQQPHGGSQPSVMRSGALLRKSRPHQFRPWNLIWTSSIEPPFMGCPCMLQHCQGINFISISFTPMCSLKRKKAGGVWPTNPAHRRPRTADCHESETSLGYIVSYSPICATYRNPVFVVHAFNPSTQEAEAGGSLSLRPIWSTEQPGQPGLLRETLSQKTKKQNKIKK